jgi:hypothetical protein
VHYMKSYFIASACIFFLYTVAHPFFIGEKLLLTQIYNPSAKKATSLVYEKRMISQIPVYDLSVLSQNQTLSAHFYRCYGCGYHAMKNLLTLVSLLDVKNPTKKQINQLLDPDVFNKLFETGDGIYASEQEALEQSSAWYFLLRFRVFRERKLGKPAPHHDRPVTTADELRFLRDQLIEQKAYNLFNRPKVMEALKVTQVIESVARDKQEIIGNTLFESWQMRPEDIFKLLESSLQFVRNASFIIPIVFAYPHAMGKHWITIIVNKMEGVSEVLFADSWRVEKQKNWLVVEKILQFLNEPQKSVKLYYDAMSMRKSFLKLNENDLLKFKHDMNQLYPGVL